LLLFTSTTTANKTSPGLNKVYKIRETKNTNANVLCIENDTRVARKRHCTTATIKKQFAGSCSWLID
jgi:hypothetical protein